MAQQSPNSMNKVRANIPPYPLLALAQQENTMTAIDWNTTAEASNAFSSTDALREAVANEAELQARQQQSNTEVLEAFRAHLAATSAYIAGLGNDDE